MMKYRNVSVAALALLFASFATGAAVMACVAAAVIMQLQTVCRDLFSMCHDRAAKLSFSRSFMLLNMSNQRSGRDAACLLLQWFANQRCQQQQLLLI
jgi:hypothetical protein